MMDHWDDAGWGAGHWLLMGLGMLVFWAAVVAITVWMIYLAAGRARIRGQGEGPVATNPASRPSARDILDERYARGEIDGEEYRHRRDTLTGTGTSDPDAGST